MIKNLFQVLVVLATGTPLAAENIDWSGPYFGLEATAASGGVDLDYAGYGHTADVSFGTSGALLGVRGGYRWALGDSGWYAGPVAAVDFGQVAGERRWGNEMASVGLSYESDLRASLGVQFGYQPSLHEGRWLFSAEGGLAGFDGKLCASAHVFAHTDSHCEAGQAFGYYVGIGAKYALDDQWGVYGSLRHYAFDGDVDSGQYGDLTAGVKYTTLAIGFEMQF